MTSPLRVAWIATASAPFSFDEPVALSERLWRDQVTTRG